MAEQDQLQNMQPTPESLFVRERFYEPVALISDNSDGVNLTGCGDERPVEGSNEVLINIFGGPAANVAWNILVMQEALNKGATIQPFADITGNVTSKLIAKGVRVTVHSDQHTEHSSDFDVNANNPDDIGCGYLKLRQTISRVIGDRSNEIISILSREKPQLYDDETNQATLKKMIASNVALAERPQIFTSGRDVAKKAVAEGSETIVVVGEHEAKVGFLNTRENTSFDTKAAMTEGLPAYNHNSWAATVCYEAIKDDEHKFPDIWFEIANDVDAIGTMLALGVEEIAVRI